MNTKQHFRSYFSTLTTQFWDYAKVDKTLKYIHDDHFYIQTPFEAIPCNLRLNKKFLIMEQDDKQYTTNIENVGLELISSDFNDDQGVRLTKGSQTFEFFGKIKSLYDQLRRLCIQFNFSKKYTIKKLIAKGTFATIYHAECKFTQHEYAVKCFEKKSISSDKDKKNLLKEMQILRMMNHKQVITIHEVYENVSFIYLVQELLNGGDLHNYLEKSEKLSEQKVCQIILNLLNGVQYMHQQGIIHRDIKPENIILRQKNDLNDIVIADFGLSDFYKHDGIYLYKKCGSPGYVAPEILRGQPYDYKVDVFSIGVIMYILLSGKRPFHGKTNQETLALNESGEINFNYLDCSTEALYLLKKLLEPQPENRISITHAKQHPFFIISQKEKKPKMKIELKAISQHTVDISPLTSRPTNRPSLFNNFTIHTPRQLPRKSQEIKTPLRTEQSESIRVPCLSRHSTNRINLRNVNTFTNYQTLISQQF